MPPLELSDEEFHQITELVRPVPYASRRGFLDAMGAAPIIGIEDR
jgi:hypothetical protein